MGAKTISFPKGKGSIRHNNREFISSNVDRSRTHMNVYFIQEPLEAAYQKCFGQALADYNAKQKRKDRIKGNYITEIKNSGNGEKVFYENVVQIGDMYDTGISSSGQPLHEDALLAAEVLKEYVRTFQERNPNLYLFNAVLHMDEATPHLHIDYIPVAHGYKTGMETRNSLTKALQQQGIPKAVSHDRNETVFWQERERAYLKNLCAERGIEICEKGEKRENLSLPAYKKTMAEVDALKEQRQELRAEQDNLVRENEALQKNIAAADAVRAKIARQTETVRKELDEGKRNVEEQNKKLATLQLGGEAMKVAEAAVKNSLGKPFAKKIQSFGKDTGYVKVEETIWKDMLEAYVNAKTKEKMLDKFMKDIVSLREKNTKLGEVMKRADKFMRQQGLYEEYAEQVLLKKRSIKERLAENKTMVDAGKTPGREHRQLKRDDVAI